MDPHAKESLEVILRLRKAGPGLLRVMIYIIEDFHRRIHRPVGRTMLTLGFVNLLLPALHRRLNG